MTEDETLLTVLDRLDGLGIPYMVVGSYASNVHGRPRATHDADIVVEIQTDDADRFVKSLESDFSMDPDSVRRHIDARSMFNLISYRSPFKIDIIPRRETAFHREEWGRRVWIEAFNRTVAFATAEDTILTKLKWYRRGGEVSGRQVEDAQGVYAVQRGRLDEDYLTRWAGVEGVADLLEKVRAGP